MKSKNLFLLFENPSFLTGFFFVLIIILVLLTLFGIFYMYLNAKSKERLLLIEKGMDPNLARGDFLTQILIIGGGFATGLMLDDKLHWRYGPLAGIFIAAIALVAYNIYKKNTSKDRWKKNS